MQYDPSTIGPVTEIKRVKRKPNPAGTEEQAIPKVSQKLLDLDPDEDNNEPYTSKDLEDYLLERWRENMNFGRVGRKDFRDIIISETAHEERVNNKGLRVTSPGVRMVMADGRILFSGYVGQNKVLKATPDYLEPMELRHGWAIWVRNGMVRIFLTEEEALGACVLYGAV